MGKMIEIPFNEWSKERLEKKVKLATSRNKRYGNIGDTFKVEIKGRIYKFELLAIFPYKLFLVAIHLYHIEGAETSTEFHDVWCDIHKRAGWTPEKIVHVHLFRLIEIM